MEESHIGRAVNGVCAVMMEAAELVIDRVVGALLAAVSNESFMFFVAAVGLILLIKG